ncbi:MAG: DUF2849 domain-containing protein [Proteobacteria bacterium]|nr:DUF2849 domain-containing protein [Pseudomonadota bacterium]
MSDTDLDTFQVVTANRLRDGAIVYLNDESGWVESISQATVASEDEIDNLIKRAEKDVAANLIVEAYPIEITGAHEPLSARERIRAAGPSVRYGDDAVPVNSSDFEI